MRSNEQYFVTHSDFSSLLLIVCSPFSLALSFSSVDELTYHQVADETLDALMEFFEYIGDELAIHQDYDVSLSVSKRYFDIG